MTPLLKIIQNAKIARLRPPSSGWSGSFLRSLVVQTAYLESIAFRGFSSCYSLRVKQLPPRPKINEEDIVENFLKGSGPGGQKINKTSVAVQLLHKRTGTVVKCQATRSRTQNRTIARKLLGDKLDEMEKGPDSRKAIKMEAARKKKASKTKKANRKYKTMADEPAGGLNDGEVLEAEEASHVDAPPGVTEQAVEENLPEWEQKWRELRGLK